MIRQLIRLYTVNLALAGLLGLMVGMHVHVYPVGAYVQVGAHWCGVEIRPTLGPFCDVT